MISVSVESLAIGFMPQPSVITLRPNPEPGINQEEFDGGDRVLPIWIGSMEATAIAAALEESRPNRPLTHGLTNNMIRAIGGQITRIVIDRVEGPTFYATIYLRCANGMFTRVDARPSDAIAIAINANAPLFVEDDVMEAGSVPRSFTPAGDKKIEIEEFHKFVENLDPSDFATR